MKDEQINKKVKDEKRSKKVKNEGKCRILTNKIKREKVEDEEIIEILKMIGKA